MIKPKETRQDLTERPASKNANTSLDFSIAYLRLDTADSERVQEILLTHAVRVAGTNSDYLREATKEDLSACHLQFKGISKEMANAWDQWALELLTTPRLRVDCHMAIGHLVDALVCLSWVRPELIGVARQR
jgi:hypothetical protein